MAVEAQLLIQSESKLNSWHILKSLLISEFSPTCNSTKLHELLSKRKIRDNDALDGYFLNMTQLRSRNNIENSVLIQYVINGIKDCLKNLWKFRYFLIQAKN